MRITSARALALCTLVGSVLALASCRSGGSSADAALEPGDVDLNQFDWLTGHWVSKTGGVVREEHWVHPSGGIMLGLSREVQDGRAIFFEFLRIERRRDGLYYVAQPRGEEPTAFRLAGTSLRRASFTNPEHDFPQRITYWREGSQLSVRVEGEREGRPVGVQVDWEKSSLPGE